MGEAALQPVCPPPRDKVYEAPTSAGTRSEGEGLATGVEGPSPSASSSTGLVLTASVLQTQNELNTLVGQIVTHTNTQGFDSFTKCNC